MSAASAAGGFAALLRRDLLIASRRPGDLLNPLLFFAIVASLFPLGVGAEQELLRALGPGVVWVAALLASLLALERLFAGDHADGSLEALLLSPHPLTVLVLAKVLAHWLLTGFPLVLAAPLVALQYGLPATAAAMMSASLAVGTPVLSLLGATGAALTLGVRGGGVLLALLVLPLYIPVLVYGAGAVAASAIDASDAGPYLQILAALLILASIFTPLATAAALRISVE